MDPRADDPSVGELLLSALVIALGSVVPLWASALIVGAVLALAGYTVARAGIHALKNLDPLRGPTTHAMQPAAPRRGATENILKERVP